MIRLQKNLYKDMVGTTSKYHNQKETIDGITFDSKKEAKRYQQLKLLEKAGLIKHLELQKKFPLQAGFKKNGKTYREISYVADFFYYDNQLHKFIVEDTKGFRTDVYKIKKKLFEHKYIDFEITEL